MKNLLILVVLVIGALVGCSDGCDGGKCISIPPTIVEVPGEEVEVPGETIIVEVGPELQVNNVNLHPVDWTNKRITLEVKNVSPYTLLKFKIKLSGGISITHVFGSGVTYQGGVVIDSNHFNPGKTLELTLDLNHTPDSNTTFEVKVL